MNKSQLEHILRASKDICKEDEYFIIGSQSLHGKCPDIPDRICLSMEVDLIVKNNEQATEMLNNIGIGSPFHETYGYYVDPVSMDTAVLPHDWKNRLVHLKASAMADGAKAYCLEPHDLAVAKIAAWRDKDKVFLRGLVEMKIIEPQKVLSLIEKVRKVPSGYSDIGSFRAAMADRFTRLVGAVSKPVTPSPKPSKGPGF